MSVKPRVAYRLSPNEEAAVLRSQREERRKARLVQVREQERAAALKVREEGRQKREKERKLLQDHLQSRLLASHAAELAAVQGRYSSQARHIGLGHRQAQQVEQEENRLHELRLLLAAKQRERAQDRHVAAMREEMSSRHRKTGERARQVERMKATREEEGRRDRETASRAPQQPTIIMDLVATKGRKVRLREVEGYSSSYYHIPSTTVQRAAVRDREEPDAQQMAELMTEEMQAVDKQSSAVQEERRELARLRHNHALSKVKMEKEKQEMLQQLKVLEREDRTLRQKALSTMPGNLYQPVQRRREEARGQQRDMEHAFERLFVRTHGVSTQPLLSQIANPTSDLVTPSPPPSRETTPTNHVASLLQHSTHPVGGRNSDPIAMATTSSVSSNNSPPVVTKTTSGGRSVAPVAIPTTAVAIPASVSEDSHSFSSSVTTNSAVTPSSLSSEVSSISLGARHVRFGAHSEETSDPRQMTTAGVTFPHAPSGVFSGGVYEAGGGRGRMGEQTSLARQPVEVAGAHLDSSTDSSSVTESAASPPHQHQQQQQQQQEQQQQLQQQQQQQQQQEQQQQLQQQQQQQQQEQQQQLQQQQQQQQQLYQQQPGELSLSELSPSETQYTSEQQPPPPTTVPLQREGMKRLVSMVQAQQQAWSQRMAARNSLLHTASALQQTTPTSSRPAGDSAAPKKEPPSLSIYSLSSRDTTVATVEGSKEWPTEISRPAVREAWAKPPLPPSTTVTHHLHPVTTTAHHPTPLHTLTHHLHPVTSTAHHPTPLHTLTGTTPPITLTSSQPPTIPPSLSQNKPPSPTQLTEESAHEHGVSVEPLSITAYNSTVDSSSMLATSIPEHRQYPMLPYSLHSYQASRPHPPAGVDVNAADTGLPSSPLSVSSNSDSHSEVGSEDEVRGDGQEGLEILSEVRERSEGSGAGISSGVSEPQHPASLYSPSASPPLVEPPSTDTLQHSSQYSTWSEGETSTTLSVDGPENPKTPVDAQTTASLPATSVSLPQFTAQNRPPSLVAPTLHSPSQPFSASQLSSSVLTPSMISGFSLTPASFLPDPSPSPPIAISQWGKFTPSAVEYTPFSVRETGSRGAQTSNMGHPEKLAFVKVTLAPPSGHSNQDTIPRPNPSELGHSSSTPANLLRPNLSIATDDTDRGQYASQDSTPCPEVSIGTAESLDTTPTHTTLHLPLDDSEFPSPSTSSTTSTLALSAPPLQPLHTLKPFEISSRLVSPLSPSSLRATDSLMLQPHTSSPPPPPSPPPAEPSSSAFSLQQAFLRKKTDFVEQSRRRLEQLKTSASERRIQSSLQADGTQRLGAVRNKPHGKPTKPPSRSEKQPKTSTAPQNTQHPSLHRSSSLPPSTLYSTGRPTAGSGSDGDVTSTGGKENRKQNRKRAVTFSSPVLQSRGSGMFSPPDEHKVKHPPMLPSRKKEIISVTEMHERNQRFYNRLPEVRRRRLEEKRSTAYAANRQKAKIYQEQVRVRMQRRPLPISTVHKKTPFK